MIKTRRRYAFTGGDYSSQEVKVFTTFCKEPSMYEVFEKGHDLYSTIASMVYNLPYNQCREFFPDGSFNLEGKKRRTNCKSLVLGILYGRGTASVADQIKSHDGPTTKEDIKEAKHLIDMFFEKYPKAKEWINQTHNDAREFGYVEDLWGRRRRLPDIQLPKYQFTPANEVTELSNPLLGSTNKKITISKSLIDKYTTQLDRARSKEAREVICAEALKEGIKIKCNSGYIAQAERQSVNARIQGSSATMTKLALRNMTRDPELIKLDFHPLIPVHDEVIGEAPVWNIEKASKRLSEVMTTAGLPECDIPMKVDTGIFTCWYSDVMEAHFEEEFDKHIKDHTPEESLELVCEEYCEFDPAYIKRVLSNKL